MRTALKNKQNLMYSNLGKTKPLYVVEDGHILTTEIDGTVIPVSAGYSNPVYEEPVAFIGNIIPVGSESYARGNVAVPMAYGIDISAYDALILMKAFELPVTETSVIWHRSEPKHKVMKDVVMLDENGNETDDPSEAVTVGDADVVDENSADYIVKRVATSQNITLILLRRMNTNAYSH